MIQKKILGARGARAPRAPPPGSATETHETPPWKQIVRQQIKVDLQTHADFLDFNIVEIEFRQAKKLGQLCFEHPIPNLLSTLDHVKADPIHLYIWERRFAP